MSKLTFADLTEVSTDIANLCFATKQQKENIRENILLLVAAGCRSYETDASFKKNIDTYSSVTYEKRNKPHLITRSNRR